MAQSRLAVLDGLRGIAVLLVLWYHLWEISWLPAPAPWIQFVPETGFIGVDLFFFISGFVIVYPFLKAQHAGSEQPTWGHFAYRRAIKILPSYLLSIAAAIAIGYAGFSSGGDAARQIVTHLLFIHTWWPQTYGGINGVLWTLAVEVNFYVAFPLIWAAFSRWPWATAAAMAVFSLAYRTYAQSCCLHGGLLGNMINNLPGYLDVFASGMVAALLYVRWRDRPQTPRTRLAATIAALGGFTLLVMLLQNVWAMRHVDQWSTVWAIHNRTLVAISFLALGLGSLLAYAWWQRLIANRFLLFFGLISYNLYLYHQFFARELLKWHFPQYRGTDPHGDPQWELHYMILATILTVAQATLVTYLFERPLLRLPLEWWRRFLSAKTKARALTDL